MTIKILGLLSVVFFFVGMNTPNTPAYYELKVLQQGQVSTVNISEGEYENISLLNNAGELYFDGEYFFQSPPFNKGKYSAKIIDYKYCASQLNVYSIVFFICLGLLICVVLVKTPSGFEDYDSYD